MFQVLGDLAIAAVLTVAAVLAAVGPVSTVEEPAPLSVLAGVLMGLPLVVRRRWPCSVLAVVTGASVLALALRWVLPHAAVVLDGVLVFAIYPVAVTASARRAVTALVLSAGGVAAAVVLAVALEPRPDRGNSLTLLGTQMIVPVAVWVVGRAVCARRAYESRAVQQVLTDERLRIARDLHDGVAHSLSLITVQASVAIHVADERPDEARSALSVIEATGREAARELRRMLGLLRVVDDEPPGTQRLEPAPTPDRLAELADHARQAAVRGRPAGRRRDRRDTVDHRARGLPHRAGVADQRGQTRRSGAVRGAGRPHRQRRGDRSDRRRRPRTGRPPPGPRADRHA